MSAALFKAIHDGDRAAMVAALDGGASVHARDEWQDTPLMMAALHGRADCLQDLIERGADIEVRNENQSTALMCAAQNNHTECLRALLHAGAEVDAQAEGDVTALMIAATMGRVEAMHMLIEQGADIHGRDTFGETPLIYAARGCVEGVRLLVDAGSDVNARSSYGSDAFTKAVHLGNGETVRYLLDKVADPEAALVHARKSEDESVQAAVADYERQRLLAIARDYAGVTSAKSPEAGREVRRARL